jgi:hypothetical protein
MPQSPQPAPQKRPSWLASGISFYGDTRSLETFGCYLGLFEGYEPKLKIYLDIDFPNEEPSVGGWSLIHGICSDNGGVKIHGSFPRFTSWSSYHFKHTTRACCAANTVAALIIELYRSKQMFGKRDPLMDCQQRAYELARKIQFEPLPSIRKEIDALRNP